MNCHCSIQNELEQTALSQPLFQEDAVIGVLNLHY